MPANRPSPSIFQGGGEFRIILITPKRSIAGENSSLSEVFMYGRHKLDTTRMIAMLLLAGTIILLVPVSAIQSSEQSISDSLTRGSRFTITITGHPNTAYYIWLTGTSTMTGKQYDQPPIISDTAGMVVLSDCVR